MSDKSDDDIPDYLSCPISGEIMRDPVILDRGEHFEGHTYDRSTINEWIKTSMNTPNTSIIDPKSGEKLGLAYGIRPILVPNHNIRQIISIWLENHPNYRLNGKIVKLTPLTYYNPKLYKSSHSIPKKNYQLDILKFIFLVFINSFLVIIIFQYFLPIFN